MLLRTHRFLLAKGADLDDNEINSLIPRFHAIWNDDITLLKLHQHTLNLVKDSMGLTATAIEINSKMLTVFN